MDDESTATSPRLRLSARRSIEAVLDRIEARLQDADDGFHRIGAAASRRELDGSGLPPEAQLLWERWDGLDLACSEAVILSLQDLSQATDVALSEGRISVGDRVIGERGRDLFVLAADPFAEGADVILVEEDGGRQPHSSTVERLVLAVLGEIAILYDEDGEFCEELYGDDGELLPAVERRMLRRHLDLDQDAPLARFRLALSLRRFGELRAAATELGQLHRRAPDFAWGNHERGRVALLLGDRGGATRAFDAAAEIAARTSLEPELRAYFLAWGALAAEGEQRAALAANVCELMPAFAAAQEAGVREALEFEHAERAREQLELGLAVAPAHLGLLSLRTDVDEISPPSQSPVGSPEDSPPRTRPPGPKPRRRDPGGGGERRRRPHRQGKVPR